ncbi:MAG: hypothetical protein J6Y89_02975 [Lachnospiraceae bacterium]|nr:hypothetical protein [Lachnospiraceae bacterium]
MENCELEEYVDLLIKAVRKQLKTGLHREYIRKKEDLTVMHGTMDIRGTVQNRLARKYLIACETDVLSENNDYNGMLKCTMMFLLRRSEIDAEKRAELKKLIMAFSEVDAPEAAQIDWKRLNGRRLGSELVELAGVCRKALEWQKQGERQEM